MSGFETRTARCPYCGESIRLLVDPDNVGQEYIEDCSVCCRPITVSAQSGGRVEVRQENDS